MRPISLALLLLPTLSTAGLVDVVERALTGIVDCGTCHSALPTFKALAALGDERFVQTLTTACIDLKVRVVSEPHLDPASPCPMLTRRSARSRITTSARVHSERKDPFSPMIFAISPYLGTLQPSSAMPCLGCARFRPSSPGRYPSRRTSRTSSGCGRARDASP